MKAIAATFKQTDYFDQILNLRNYDSIWGILPRKYNIATPILRFEEDHPIIEGTLVENVLQQLRTKIDPAITELHFLGHSMGGLVIRALIKAVIMPDPANWLFDGNSPAVKSVVLLATPNQGTEVTYMKLAGILHRLQTTFFSLMMPDTMKAMGTIKAKISDKEAAIDQQVNSTACSQINQMQPNSYFLQWLNASPTYTDVIPHFFTIGSQNIFLFTNLAFEQENMNQHRLTQIKDLVHCSTDMHFPDEHLSVFDRIFRAKGVCENDGVVSHYDAALLGATYIDLGEYSGDINHFSVYMWNTHPGHHVKAKILGIYMQLFAA